MTPNLARSNRQIRALWLRKPPMNSTDLGDKDPQQVTRFKIKQAMFDSTNCCTHGRLRSFVDHRSLKVQIRDVICRDDTLITIQTEPSRLAISSMKYIQDVDTLSTSHGSSNCGVVAHQFPSVRFPGVESGPVLSTKRTSLSTGLSMYSFFGRP